MNKNNHGDIPYNFVYKGVSTGRWVSNQRSYSKKKGGMQYLRCTDRERIKAFDEIGVDLRPKKGSAAIKCDKAFGERFMSNYAALCKWRNENGGFVGVPPDLKDFCTEVRERYASKNLSKDQTNCLVNIDFPWTDFDEGFKQLMTFKMSEKHFNVPEDHVCFSWTKEIRRLYKENNLPEMAQHILVANGFPFNDPILPCPRRTDEPSHIKFSTIDKRPANDVMVGGQRSSVSRKNAGSNKRRARMASKVRGNSNDDGHDDGYNDGKSHGYDGNANNKDNYDEDDEDDDNDAYDDYDKGDHGGHDDDDRDDDSKEFDDDHDDGSNNEDDDGNDEDDHNDDDDNDEGFNHSSNATRFATGRGQPAAKQRVVSMQKSRMLKGPRNVLRDDESDDSGYFDRHAETDIDDAAIGNTNSDSVGEEENDDINNPIFGNNATLPDEFDNKRRAGVEDSQSKNDSIGSNEEFDAEPSNKDGGILADVTSELASNEINKEPEIINMNKVKSMKKADLKKGCKEYGLETDGNRPVLILRLYRFYSENPKYNPKNW